MSTDTTTIGTRRGEGSGRWWAMAALVLSGLVLGLDATILVTALPTLSAQLGATTSQLQWILDAYTLALGGLLLPAGVLGDHLGRRRMLLIGLALFGVSSVLASQMTSATGLIWMRALMGAGGAIIMPLSLSILPSLFSEQERPRAVALASVGAFLGLPLGPLVAGWLLTHFAWGSVFLINVPVVAVALLGVWFLVPESLDPDAPRLDWIGAVLAVIGVTAVVYGIIEEPGDGWTDPRVLAGIAGGAVVLGLFVAHELRTRWPLIDLGLFRNRRFTWSTVAFVVIGAAMFGGLFVVSPYLQVVQGNDAQATGIKLLPLIGAVVVGAAGSDRLTARLGIRVTVPGGLLVTATGLLLLSRVGADSGYGMVAAGLAVMGLGMGLGMPPALDAILGTLPPERTGGGTALTRTLQQVGASLGVAILGSILNGAYRASIGDHLAGLPARVQDVAQSSVGGAAAVAQHLPGPLAGPLFRAAKVAYAQGMSEVLLVSAGLVIAGAVLVALFMPGRATSAATAEAEASPLPRLA
jgi:MFS transporter, DHA2 family, multidrug resistance protein